MKLHIMSKCCKFLTWLWVILRQYPKNIFGKAFYIYKTKTSILEIQWIYCGTKQQCCDLLRRSHQRPDHRSVVACMIPHTRSDWLGCISFNKHLTSAPYNKCKSPGEHTSKVRTKWKLHCLTSYKICVLKTRTTSFHSLTRNNMCILTTTLIPTWWPWYSQATN